MSEAGAIPARTGRLFPVSSVVVLDSHSRPRRPSWRSRISTGPTRPRSTPSGSSPRPPLRAGHVVPRLRSESPRRGPRKTRCDLAPRPRRARCGSLAAGGIRHVDSGSRSAHPLGGLMNRLTRNHWFLPWWPPPCCRRSVASRAPQMTAPRTSMNTQSSNRRVKSSVERIPMFRMSRLT